MEFPETTSLFWKENRLKTFNGWPFTKSDKCNSECMSAAGFYAIGNSNEPDLVECFICGKQLDGWEPNDDPWNEHKKHEPSCSFIKLNKQNEKELTVDELYNLYKKYEIKKYMDELGKNVNVLKDEAAQFKDELSAAYKTRKNKKSII